MAKALLGYSIGTDAREASRLVSENSALRQRVLDLQELVMRLQQENDALAAVASESVGHAVARDSGYAHS